MTDTTHEAVAEQIVTVEVAWIQPGPECEITRRAVEGWESGVPGLVLIREPISPGYQLIHQPSGCRVRGLLASRRLARRLAESLRGHADWTLPSDELHLSEEAMHVARGYELDGGADAHR